ncbi:hypothetical protein IJ182_05920 [bacterium]|nr:hypothetical protein [bacterium]
MLKVRNNILLKKSNMNNKKSSFEVNPLDVNIAKIQYSLINRLEREMPENGDFAPVVERYQSKDPTLDLSTVKVACRHVKSSEKSNNQRCIEASCKNKAETHEISKILAVGTKKQIIDYVKDTQFFEKCKELAKSDK